MIILAGQSPAVESLRSQSETQAQYLLLAQHAPLTRFELRLTLSHSTTQSTSRRLWRLTPPSACTHAKIVVKSLRVEMRKKPDMKPFATTSVGYDLSQ